MISEKECRVQMPINETTIGFFEEFIKRIKKQVGEKIFIQLRDGKLEDNNQSKAQEIEVYIDEFSEAGINPYDEPDARGNHSSIMWLEEIILPLDKK